VGVDPEAVPGQDSFWQSWACRGRRRTWSWRAPILLWRRSGGWHYRRCCSFRCRCGGGV